MTKTIRSGSLRGPVGAMATIAAAVFAGGAVPTAEAVSVSLDPSFGSAGTLALPLSPGSNADEAFAVVVDGEGRIVVAGYSSSPQQKMTVARLDASGALDESFGDGGVVKLDLGVRARAQAVAVQPDGRIVIAGFAVLLPSGNEQFVAARLLEDGTPDPDFGSGGAVATAFGSRDARAAALALQEDGGIVVAGWARNSANRDVAVVRYDGDGVLDPGFGTGGTIVWPIGTGNDEATSVAIDGQQRIVLAGYAVDGSTHDLLAARLTAGGAPDVAFAGTGFRRVAATEGVEQANALLLQAGGGIVVAGQAKIDGNTRVALARLTDAGALDATFGIDGIRVTAIGELAEGKAIAASTRDRFVVAGRARLPGGKLEFFAARYSADGAPDPTFGDGGLLRIALGLKSDEAYAIAPDDDGAMVLAGTMRIGNDANFGLARLLVDDCGDGFLDDGEQCDEGNEASCCSSTCTLLPADEVCRAVADACDAAEVCDGTSAACGVDEGLPDADEDGVCDEQDLCPADADPSQSDADGDGEGDACDSCTNGVTLERPTLRFGDLQTPGGDDFVKIIGTASLPPGTVLNPRSTGARVVVRAADGSVLFDVSVSPGAFDPVTKVGWQVTGGGKVHKFRSPDPFGGMVRKFRMVRALTSGRHHVKIVGSPLDLSTMPLFGALSVSVSLDVATLGRCAELEFGGPEHSCALNEPETTLVCK